MKRINVSAFVALGLMVFAFGLTRRGHDAVGGPMKLAAVDFKVGSSGDAGPGTLRDAVLAADRLSGHAHIVITAKRVILETALPPLVNPHGVTLEAAADAGIIDADHVAKGAVLQLSGPATVIRGVHVVHAHDAAILANAPGIEIESVSVSESKVAVMLGAAAKGCAIRTSLFERNETGVTAEAAIRDVTIAGSIFRDNSRAGFWFVGAPEQDAATPGKDSVRIVDSVFERNASGIVLANRPTLIQKSRFLGNRESALLVLGGPARIEDSEIRGSGATAISVTGGKQVLVARNILVANSATAIMVRDSGVLIEHNFLEENGFGIVAVLSENVDTTTIRDNVIGKSRADAITLIGGAVQLQRNQVVDNHGAGLRVLDLVLAKSTFKAAPQLDANVLKGNGIDMPPPGVYKLAGVLAPP